MQDREFPRGCRPRRIEPLDDRRIRSARTSRRPRRGAGQRRRGTRNVAAGGVEAGGETQVIKRSLRRCREYEAATGAGWFPRSCRCNLRPSRNGARDNDRHPRRTAHQRARSSGWAWTRPSSTTPTTRRSMRRTSRWCMRAARPRMRAPRRGSARRSASNTAPARSRASTSTAARARNAPINVYIHGGAWRNGRSADFALLSEMIVECRRAQRHRRLQQYRRRRRQPDDHGEAGALGGRLGLQQRRQIRRRQEPALCHRPFVGRPPDEHASSPATGRRISACRRTS